MINAGTEDTLVLCFQGLNHHCALFYCSEKAPVSMSEGSFDVTGISNTINEMMHCFPAYAAK